MLRNSENTIYMTVPVARSRSQSWLSYFRETHKSARSIITTVARGISFATYIYLDLIPSYLRNLIFTPLREFCRFISCIVIVTIDIVNFHSVKIVWLLLQNEIYYKSLSNVNHCKNFMTIYMLKELNISQKSSSFVKWKLTL